jgi:hypothetical protein
VESESARLGRSIRGALELCTSLTRCVVAVSVAIWGLAGVAPVGMLQIGCVYGGYRGGNGDLRVQ